jgi:hypothetical protein
MRAKPRAFYARLAELVLIRGQTQKQAADVFHVSESNLEYHLIKVRRWITRGTKWLLEK